MGDVFGPGDLCSRSATTNLPGNGFDQDQQSSDRFSAQKCYEDFYCARGDMENQIKQQYLDLDADRTSTHWMASNQLRLWFSAFALLLFQRLRTLALKGTELANATAGTIRQRLLKIGALITVSTRRVYVRLASAFPLQNVFAHAHRAPGRVGAGKRVISPPANFNASNGPPIGGPIRGNLPGIAQNTDSNRSSSRASKKSPTINFWSESRFKPARPLF
jgi:hypothetical protein